MTLKSVEHSAYLPSAAPILPEQCRTNDERMEQHTDLAWLFGGIALPLALLTERAGTTTVNAEPQASMSLLPPLLEYERAACWTAQRSIGLERKILSCEATRFP